MHAEFGEKASCKTYSVMER